MTEPNIQIINTEQQSTLDQFMLPLEEFMKALQVEGKIDEESEARLLLFPEIDKFSKSFIKYFKTIKVSFVPLNVTHINKNVRDIIIKRRKLVDATDLSSNLQIFQNKDGMVYIINWRTETSAFDLNQLLNIQPRKKGT